MAAADLERLGATRGTAVISGPGTFDRVGDAAAALVADGQRAVLLVCDPFLAEAGLAARATATLAAAGLVTTVFTDIRSDPLARQIDAAAAAARQAGAGLVVGIGGGSALDVAKLAAAVAAADASAEAYACAAIPLPEAPLPFICVPTTAGTGSEATRTSVYTLADGAKVWAWGDALRPKGAILDPVLTVGLPPGLTAATAVDAMVHAIEAYTSRRATGEADSWALDAIRLVVAYLPAALRDPADLGARGALLKAACLAGFAIDTCGTGVAHALGHALGTIGHVHHGRAVGLSLRVALAGNVAAAPTRHAAVARAFGLDAGDDGALADTVLTGQLPAAYDAFLRAVGLGISLAPEGLGPSDAGRLAAATLEPENRPMLEATCRTLTPEDVALLAEALLAAR